MSIIGIVVEPLYDTKHLIDIMVEICRYIGKENAFFEAISKSLGVSKEKLADYYRKEGVAGIRRAQAEALGLDYGEIVRKGSVFISTREKLLKTMPYTKPLPTPTG